VGDDNGFGGRIDENAAATAMQTDAAKTLRRTRRILMVVIEIKCYWAGTWIDSKAL
jgi:hypothetical protein